MLPCMLIVPASSLHNKCPALVQCRQGEGERVMDQCICHAGGSGAVKSWLLHSPRTWKTKAKDLPHKCQREHLLP